MKKIFVIGDSISIQYGPYLEKLLQGRLHYARKEGIDLAMTNLDLACGANAGNSAQVLNYLQIIQSEGSFNADFILVNCGLHDIKADLNSGEKDIPLDQYQQNLQAIVDLVTAMDCKMIWLRTTPCRDDIHNAPGRPFHRFEADNLAYNAAADDIMNRSRIPMIDLYSFTLNLDGDLYCDHVHFTETVRQKQAAFIAQWLFDHVDQVS